MKVAVARYPIDMPASFDAFAAKQRDWLGRAAAQGAELAVLPEYLSLELAGTFSPVVRADLAASLEKLQAWQEAWHRLYGGLAREFGLTVQAGSFLTAVGGVYRNRAWWYSPGGRRVFQDKLQLTGFEKASGLIAGGDALHVFDAGGVRAGIAVCYDIEFPLPVRAQCEAGARLLLVPSCTDTAAGATRVRVGALARALENRVFVAQAVTSGVADWSPALDVNTGEAAIYAPMDRGLPDDGIVAQTRGVDGWAIAELDFAALDASRAEAQVANDRDWPGQGAPGLVRARVLANSTIGELFYVTPGRYGLRGDAHLWGELKERFATVPMPATSQALRAALVAAIEHRIGTPLATGEYSVHIPALDHGGMSGGHVHFAWWRDTCLPMLLERAALPDET